MKILVDMNLTPKWCDLFHSSGYDAVHWRDVGDPGAPDSKLMAWAFEHDYVLFTHDLDFGALLAATRQFKPSIIQVRTEDILPSQLGHMVLSVLKEHQIVLEKGALVVVDSWHSRVRILPIR
jgi:predicted nuclease of predicted toxin-antitoxin system